MTPTKELREQWAAESRERFPESGLKQIGYCIARERSFTEMQGQAPHIRIEISKLPEQGEKYSFGYCADCNHAGIRHCAHADSCGRNVSYAIIREGRIEELEKLIGEIMDCHSMDEYSLPTDLYERATKATI